MKFPNLLFILLVLLNPSLHGIQNNHQESDVPEAVKKIDPKKINNHPRREYTYPFCEYKGENFYLTESFPIKKNDKWFLVFSLQKKKDMVSAEGPNGELAQVMEYLEKTSESLVEYVINQYPQHYSPYLSPLLINDTVKCKLLLTQKGIDKVKFYQQIDHKDLYNYSKYPSFCKTLHKQDDEKIHPKYISSKNGKNLKEAFKKHVSHLKNNPLSLHKACALGSVDFVRALLKKGMDPNQKISHCRWGNIHFGRRRDAVKPAIIALFAPNNSAILKELQMCGSKIEKEDIDSLIEAGNTRNYKFGVDHFAKLIAHSNNEQELLEYIKQSPIARQYNDIKKALNSYKEKCK